MKLQSARNCILCLVLLPANALHAATTVAGISVGFGHSLFLESDGSLWGMGDSSYGELGDGGSPYVAFRPQQIVANGVTAITAGQYSTLFLKSDGSLWAMGLNEGGELGDGTYDSTNRPQQIVASGVTAISAGLDHSLFIKSDGSLWAMGRNSQGELGDGTVNPYGTNRPEQIVDSRVSAISAGGYHSLFLKTDGSLWAMGDQNHGQLGDGTNATPANPNIGTNQPEQIISAGVIAIAAGGIHSLFLKADGSLWAMGDNDFGQLGDGSYSSTNRPEQIVASGVAAIAAGYYYSLFIKSDGSLWGMGENSYGQLGFGTFSSNSAYATPSATNTPQQIVAGGVTAIAARWKHNLFIKSDGTLWGIGYNYDGELGDGFIDAYTNHYATATPEQILPSPQPALSVTRASQTDLQFTATCGFGGNFYLLAGTNLTQPTTQWTPVWTNSIVSRGSNNFTATLTNAVTSAAQQFFILQSH